MDIKGKKIVVVGLARTGAATARFLKDRHADVLVTDIRTEETLCHYVNELNGLDIKMRLGEHPAEIFADADLVVVSPGVCHDIAPLRKARANGAPVIGEVELAGRFIKEPIVAVTGTNGKTTTTTLIGRMLDCSGIKTYVGGNIGTPLIEYASGNKPADVIVAEISSFQLDTIDRFRPHVGVLLNITEDHLDRYADFAAYCSSKKRLFENQTNSDVAILNAQDPCTGAIAAEIRCGKLFFDTKAPAAGGAAVNGRKITCLVPGREPALFDLTNFSPEGRHNLENAAAAALAALSAGGTEAGIQDALDHFKGLPHRLAFVRSVNGVDYYDDSKGTNVDSLMRSLESFDAPVFLIIGGRDKGGGYSRLEPLIRKRAKKLFAIGEAGEKIIRALGACVDIMPVAGIQEAVANAHREAVAGDVVLLSPACSSFDMFRDYAERGEVFCKAVRLIDEDGK